MKAAFSLILLICVTVLPARAESPLTPHDGDRSDLYAQNNQSEYVSIKRVKITNDSLKIIIKNIIADNFSEITQEGFLSVYHTQHKSVCLNIGYNPWEHFDKNFVDRKYRGLVYTEIDGMVVFLEKYGFLEQYFEYIPKRSKKFQLYNGPIYIDDRHKAWIFDIINDRFILKELHRNG